MYEVIKQYLCHKSDTSVSRLQCSTLKRTSVYQTSVETSADLGVKIILRQSLCEIHETCISGQFQLTNEQMLIIVAAENNHHVLCIMPLFNHGLDFTTWRYVI